MDLCFKNKAKLSPYSVAVPSACKEHRGNLGWQSGKRGFSPDLPMRTSWLSFYELMTTLLNPKHTGNVQNLTTVTDLAPSEAQNSIKHRNNFGIFWSAHGGWLARDSFVSPRQGKDWLSCTAWTKCTRQTNRVLLMEMYFDILQLRFLALKSLENKQVTRLIGTQETAS